MDLVLDGRGRLYVQLARALKQAILSGRIRHGTRIPPTRDMVAMTGLSRTTVVAAYEHLQAEGYLEAKVGSGSYVTAPNLSKSSATALSHRVAAQSAFSERARGICSLGAIPGIRDPSVRYAFQYSMPQLSSTISTEWARVVARVAPYVKPNYPAIQGLPELRAAIHDHIRTNRGIECDPDDILIVNGTQQAVMVTARVLINSNDPVAIEEPQYFGTRQILQLEGADVFGIPVDEHGMRVAELSSRYTKLVCVTPSHQFPTGAVLSKARREALLEYAHGNHSWIIEDDYDGDFRHDEMPIESLHSMDPHGRVIYIGSFSKTLFPAVRLGFVVMPRGLRGDFLSAKWACDFALPALEQVAMTEMINSGTYTKHLRKSASLLAGRRRAMRQAFQRPPFEDVRLTGANAGMHLMAWLPELEHQDLRQLLALAKEKGVGLYSAEPFFMDQAKVPSLMMGFSAIHANEIPIAVGLLGECLHACRAGAKAPRPKLTIV
jgi:GntR family transcriptional regulator/MocR family aminotransferase